MRFRAMAPHPHLRIAALAALAGAALSFAPATNSQGALPSMGDPSDLTVGAERRLGENIARELYRDPDVMDDPILAAHVQALWDPLMRAARARGDITPEQAEQLAWRVVLVRDRTVNAFALPGGYFGVHLGMIAATQSRAELASVLAHELSHVTQRHIARLLTRQNQQTPLLLAAMLLGAMAASRSPDAAGAAFVGGQALAAQQQLNFSRDMEREADRVGFGVATEAGYPGSGFVSMFERLYQANRLSDSGAFPYLRSHPLTTERIADMQSRLPPGELARAGPPDRVHAMMSARARVLAQRAAISEPAPRAQDSVADTAAVFYARTLLARQRGDHAAARAALARLAEAARGDAQAEYQVRLLAAATALAEGDAARAAGLLPLVTVDRAGLLLAAQARLSPDEARETAARLLQWVSENPQDAQAWQTLAQAHQAAGQPLRALRAQAEVLAAQGDVSKAVDTLRAAQDRWRKTGPERADDWLDVSIIDARHRELAERLRRERQDDPNRSRGR